MRSFLKYARWFYRNSEGVRGAVILNIVLGILTVFLNLLFIWISKRLVDFATGDFRGGEGLPGGLSTWLHEGAGGPETLRVIVIFAVAMVAVILVRLTVAALNTRLESVTYSKMNFLIRSRLYSNLLQSQWTGKEKFHSGDTLNRLFSDVDVVTRVICSDFPSFVTTVFQFAAAFVFLALMDLRLAILIAVITPLLLGLSKVFFVRMRQLTKEIRQTEGKVQSHLQESLYNRTVIQSLDNEDQAQYRLDSLQQEEYSQVLRRTRYSVFSKIVFGAAFQLGYAAAFIWGVVGIYRGATTFGMMTAFLQLVAQIQTPSRRLAQLFPSFIYATASVDRLSELEDSEKEKTGEQVLLPGVAGVRIENLTFKYPDGERPVFKDFSYDFAPGTRTAIVGETGVGKSTLIKLMLSLLKPSDGRLYVYSFGAGKTLSAGDPSQAPYAEEVSSLTRANLVYVPQGNSLFSGTIRENLLMGDPEATEDQMLRVLHIAAADFVNELPDGLDTVCGERGAGLSEGQAQRIAIARGLLRPGSILLLDEFSSSLDPDTERLLMERLTGSDDGKTMIFIAHRERISEYCDRTLRLVRTD